MSYFLRTILILGLIFFLFFFLLPEIKEKHNGCEEFKEMISEDFNAIIFEKYVDEENHNFKTLILKEGNIKTKKILTQGYKSMYTNLEKGDSLIKKSNQDYYTIKKKNNRLFLIKFRNICKP